MTTKTRGIIGRPSTVVALAPQIAAWLRETPAPTGVEVLKRARKVGYRGGKSALYELTRRLRAPLLALIGLLLVGCATPSQWLINADGRTILCSAQGYGYIGAPMAVANVEQCAKNYRKVGYIDLPDVVFGVEFASFDGQGGRVKRLVPGTPAETSGLQPGDVLETIDGVAVHDWREAAIVLNKHQPGDRVTVDVTRDGAPLTFELSLARR